MKVCVMGLGYIGLPTASVLATKGFQVHGVDVNKEVVSSLNEGKVLITEPDLDILVKSAVNSEKLVADLKPAKADVFIISVPTPFKDGFKPDLSYIDSATDAILPYVEEGNLVILESTVPVGTTRRMAERIYEAKPELRDKVSCAHCPERVLPGQILKELIENDRIVGGLDTKSTEQASAFYRSFVSGDVIETNAKTAELSKLAENSYRDVNIAFANELSMLCDDLEIDPWELIKLANRHPRVNILNPGVGVGGHCIAVDPWFIVHSSPEQTPLIQSARSVNTLKPKFIAQKISDVCQNNNTKKVSVFGLAYKQDVDDLRESASVELVKELQKLDLEVVTVEPYVKEIPKSIGDAKLLSASDAMKSSDVLVFTVKHKQFLEMNLDSIRKESTVIDVCGIFNS